MRILIFIALFFSAFVCIKSLFCPSDKIASKIFIKKKVHLFQVIDNPKNIYLVCELASGGELFDLLLVKGRMKERIAKQKFYQLCSAVSYCHRKYIVHRDLKAENILLDENENIKLADFGFANYYSNDGLLDTYCGSPPYAAPELFQARKYIGPEVDVWSLGVILYSMVTGSLPFDGSNIKVIMSGLFFNLLVKFYLVQKIFL